MKHDAIVIGSGFGGAVLACRLAEKGWNVLVLERGRRWGTRTGPGVTAFPREAGDPWLWDPAAPHKRNGWLDLRLFGGMAVAQGAAVGGGSQIYANISVEAEPWVFQKGWPREITYDALKPHYDRVAEMMAVRTLPTGQETARWKLMREGAEKIGAAARFRPVPLAVSFRDGFDPEAPGARDDRNSWTHTNAQGVEQGTCVHCGNCDIGCQVGAKNTLDLNYLARAEAKGAEVRPLHLATRISPEPGGWRVDFDQLVDGERRPGSASASKVFLSAGSLGSTELLLRCRDEFRTLPNLSGRLGHGWSSNGDFLTPAFYSGRKIHPSHGPPSPARSTSSTVPRGPASSSRTAGSPTRWEPGSTGLRARAGWSACVWGTVSRGAPSTRSSRRGIRWRT